jgi:hypothetical protein
MIFFQGRIARIHSRATCLFPIQFKCRPSAMNSVDRSNPSTGDSHKQRLSTKWRCSATLALVTISPYMHASVLYMIFSPGLIELPTALGKRLEYTTRAMGRSRETSSINLITLVNANDEDSGLGLCLGWCTISLWPRCINTASGVKSTNSLNLLL